MGLYNDQLDARMNSAPQVQWKDFFYFTQPGLFLEFGVSSGESMRIISNIVTSDIWGFDSFEGLPEDWVSKYGDTLLKGTFSSPVPTDLPPHVKFVKGLFQDTLPNFLINNPHPISLMHMDADLYSSTKFVLETTSNQLNGAVVVFDEITENQMYEDHEGRAFREFLAESKYQAVCIGKHHPRGAGFKLFKPT